MIQSRRYTRPTSVRVLQNWCRIDKLPTENSIVRVRYLFGSELLEEFNLLHASLQNRDVFAASNDKTAANNLIKKSSSSDSAMLQQQSTSSAETTVSGSSSKKQEALAKKPAINQDGEDDEQDISPEP